MSTENKKPNDAEFADASLLISVKQRMPEEDPIEKVPRMNLEAIAIELENF